MDTSLFLTAVGTIAAIIAIWQTHRANRLSAAITRQDVSDVELVLFGQRDVHEFALALPLKGDAGVQLPMTLNLRNKGQKTTRDLELFVRIPRRLIYGGGIESMDAEGSRQGVKVRTIAQTQDVETVLISVATLNPGVVRTLEFMITASEQTHHQPAAPNARRTDHTGQHSLYNANDIEIVITQADCAATAERYSILVIDTSAQSIAEFFASTPIKVARRFMRREPARDVVVIEVPAEHVVPVSELPIHRVRYRAPVCIYKGIRFYEGYFIPSAGVRLGARR